MLKCFVYLNLCFRLSKKVHYLNLWYFLLFKFFDVFVQIVYLFFWKLFLLHKVTCKVQITIIKPQHVISYNVAFWHEKTQTSLCSLLLSLENPNDVRSVA